jgi:hypothetical protein
MSAPDEEDDELDPEDEEEVEEEVEEELDESDADVCARAEDPRDMSTPNARPRTTARLA